MAKVAIKTPEQQEAVVYDITATTFGELKTELKQSVNFAKKEVIVRETRNALIADDSLLPQGDFTLYLFPKEVKSGLDLENMNYNELRSYGSKLNKEEDANIDLKGNYQEMLSNIQAYLANKGIGDIEAKVEETKQVINLAIDELYETVKAHKEEVPAAVFLTTQEEIEEDFRKLAKELGIKLK